MFNVHETVSGGFFSSAWARLVEPLQRRWIAPAVLLLLGIVLARGQARADATTGQLARAQSVAASLPMAFEANRGQFEDNIHFRARGAGYSVVLQPAEAVLLLGETKLNARKPERHERGQHRLPGRRGAVESFVSAVIQLKLEGANGTAEVSGEEQLPGIVNYFLGSDPKLWRTSVPTFARVRYHGVYPGVDLVYYGNQRQLEYDFVVAPGADAGRIQLRMDGADALSVASNGDLVV
ncbi:MAG: hypothetical protein EPO07_20525, partial [Verrucomicrobia bacterium]